MEYRTYKFLVILFVVAWAPGRTISAKVLRAGGSAPVVIMHAAPVILQKQETFRPYNWEQSRRDNDLNWTSSVVLRRRLNEAANAISLRNAPADFWNSITSDARAPTNWRLFAAYQLFVGHARPGSRLGQLVRLFRDCTWLKRQRLKSAGGAAFATGRLFSISVESPGEPGGRILIALNQKTTSALLYVYLRGQKVKSLSDSIVIGIGLAVSTGKSAPRGAVPRLAGASQGVLLLAPSVSGTPRVGQTLDEWALAHYQPKIDTAPDHWTPERIILHVKPMPSDFWVSLANNQKLPRYWRLLAAQEIFETLVTPGETFGQIAKVLRGASWLRPKDVTELDFGPDFPYFTTTAANNGTLRFLNTTTPWTSDEDVLMSLSRELTRRQVWQCLRGQGKPAWLKTRVLGLAPTTIEPR